MQQCQGQGEPSALLPSQPGFKGSTLNPRSALENNFFFFLLLNEINRERKDFQVPPRCNGFSPAQSLFLSENSRAIQKRCEKKKKKRN